MERIAWRDIVAMRIFHLFIFFEGLMMGGEWDIPVVGGTI